MTPAESEAKARFARLEAAKAEWAEVKKARAQGLPEPDAPNLRALEDRTPLVTAVGQAVEGQAEDLAARRSAAARKAWETRRRNAGGAAR